MVTAVFVIVKDGDRVDRHKRCLQQWVVVKNGAGWVGRHKG